MNDKRDYDMLYNVFVMGDKYSGKSSLMKRITEDVFTDQYEQLEDKAKTVVLTGKKIKTRFWEDSPNTRRKDFGVPRNAHAIIYVVNLTDKEQFNNLSKSNDFADARRSGKPIIIVGTSSDRAAEREITDTEIREFAKEHGCKYIEASAKTGQNVDQVLVASVKEVMKASGYQLNALDRNNIKEMVDKIKKALSATNVPLIRDALLNKAKSEVAKMLQDNHNLHDPQIRKAYFDELKEQIGSDRSNVALGIVSSLMRDNERTILLTRTVRPMPEVRQTEELVSEMIKLMKSAQGSSPNSKDAERQLNSLINDIHSNDSIDKLIKIAERYYNNHDANRAAQNVMERLFARQQDLKINLTVSQQKEIASIASELMVSAPNKKSPLDNFKKNREVLSESFISRLDGFVSKMDNPRQIQLCKQEFNNAAQRYRERNPENVHFEKCLSSVMKRLDARESELRAQKEVQFRAK